MTLKKREKIFALVVVALLVVFALYWIWPSDEDSLNALNSKIAALNKVKSDAQTKTSAPTNLDALLETVKKTKNDKQLEAAQLKKDTDRLPGVLSRALPSDPAIAKSVYQNWLLKLSDDKFTNVSLDSQEPQKDLESNDKTSRIIYEKLRFTIHCLGTLDQLTGFLFDFYSAGHLQKICSIKINPVTNNPAQLDLSIAVEALSLPGAKQTDQLSTEKGNRLKLASADAYNKVIVKRNPFVAYAPPKNDRPRGEPPPPAKIDPLQFSFLTGIIEADGVPEALLYQRTTDETLKVHEGEEFTIGKVKGKVNRIGYNDINIEIDGKTLTVSLGNSLKM